MTTTGPVDELAVRAALRRLDELVVRHPELTGSRGEDNVAAWVATLDDNEKGQMTMTPRSTDEGVQLAFRIPKTLIARIDRHAERLSKANPGLEFTRSDAVRTLLTRALDEVETSEKRRGK